MKWNLNVSSDIVQTCSSVEFCSQDLAAIGVLLLRWMRAWHPPTWTWPGLLLAYSVADIQKPAKCRKNMAMSKSGGKRTMLADGESQKASTTMNPKKPFMLLPNLAWSPRHIQDRWDTPTLQTFGLMVSMSNSWDMNGTPWRTTAKTLQALQSISNIIHWKRQKAWNLPFHLSLTVTTPTMSDHHILQDVWQVSVGTLLTFQSKKHQRCFCM